jgi:DNA-binding NarL/FixJ family response regulator
VEDVGRLTEAERLLAAGRWEQARQLLADVLAQQESPDAHHGIGTALWWLCCVRESLDHRELAYAGYLAQHRHAEAAMVALDISVCQLTNLDNLVAARGWIARARRSVDIAREDRLDGWLWLMEAYTCDEPQQQRALLTQALQLARRLGDPDMELAALSDLGLALVSQGDVPDGLKLLDEAMAGTLGGECRRLDTVVWASCSMLAACSLVGDHVRAAQWCGAADRFVEKYGCPFLQARCRSHYGRVLVELGDWDQAEIELNQALAMSADCGREPRSEALAGLAELRLRAGAIEQAANLLEEMGDLPSAAVITAEVLIAQGHSDRAVAILQNRLAALAGNEAEFPVVAAGLVDACLAHGDVAAAAAAARALQQASPDQHPQTAALRARADGRVAASTGDTDLAERRLRTAVAEFERLDLPFQAARARLELARILAHVNRTLAIVEAGRALDRLERLGAEREAGATAEFLRGLGVATRPGPRHYGLLTRRELEVLERLRRGLTNPEIAAQLFISRRTVAHHVSSILTKLNLKTRSEAAAYAASHQRPSKDHP